MKYLIQDIKIPMEKRKDINDKIIHCINNNLCDQYGLTQSLIFNTYSGDGGTFDIQFKDYNNYYEFSQAKKELEQGEFYTPHKLAKFLTDCIKVSNTDLVGDLTLGMGNFINYMPVESNFYGTELNVKSYKIARHLYPLANIKNEDIRYYNVPCQLDVIFLNPPYNLKWDIGRDEISSQLYCVKKAAETLKPSGVLGLIVPESFLKDDFSNSGEIKQINELFNFVCQFDLPMNIFKGVGVDSFKTKILILQRKSEYIQDKPYNPHEKIEIIGVTDDESERIYNTYIKPIMEQKEKVRAKLYFETIHGGNLDESRESEFSFKATKLLYDIKRNPKINMNYGKCLDIIQKYRNQEKPKEMDYKEWDKKKLTENKVLAYLNGVLKKQNEVERDEIKLVKTSYGLKLKAYSRKSKLKLAKVTCDTSALLNDIVLSDNYPFEDTKYKKLIERKRNEYLRQSKSFKDMAEDGEIREWLNNFTITDHEKNEIIKLNPKQKECVGKELQKRYGILNTTMGTGKSVMAISWYNYIKEHNTVKNVFVIAPALAITLTWVKCLERYKEDFIHVKSLKDIDNIKEGQIVLLSFSILNRLHKKLKKYIKHKNQKVVLVVDESDELINPNSQRTKSTLSIFKKVRFKLLTTGTTQRNQIGELYSQLQLLYNNSINMLCECKDLYRESKETGKIECYANLENYMKPFNARHGYQLFKNCFSPAKSSVFGIKRSNQDIYNMDSLIKLIEKSIVTKTFKEIVGEDKYTINTIKIKQNESEKQLYLTIMKEFYTMVNRYFRSTGNYKKDAILKIVRQMQLLIKSTSIPNTFKEYNNLHLPEKQKYIVDMIKNNNEKIMLGTVFVDACYTYHNLLKSEVSDRPIFLIKGDVSFKARNSIIKQFEESDNGILISTQQSLKSSVNIPSCNFVIVESLQWNIPTLQQYYFRAIRMNSKDVTKVNIVTYDNTIQQNMLALLMNKEQINDFIKTLEYREKDEIYEEFGIDMSILDNIIEKEYDEEGRSYLTWSEQKIV